MNVKVTGMMILESDQVVTTIESKRCVGISSYSMSPR